MGGFEVTVENAVTMPKMDVLVGFDGVPEICWKKQTKKKFQKIQSGYCRIYGDDIIGKNDGQSMNMLFFTHPLPLARSTWSRSMTWRFLWYNNHSAMGYPQL
jgi:hypothetical protein